MLKKNMLGRTKFKVAEIGFGAWQIGGGKWNYGKVPEEDAKASLDAYFKRGGNFIDTARIYGDSERILGEYLLRRGGREDIILASKTQGQNPNQIRNDLKKSLQLLQTDYIDLYYIHSPPDDPAEMKCLLEVFEELKNEGKIRAIGSSVKGANITSKTVDLCRQYIHSGSVDVLLVGYSIFRQKNAEMLQEAVNNDVGIVARSVLESGFLTGEYSLENQFAENDHRSRWEKGRLRSILQTALELKNWAVEPPYKNLAQVAIRFALDRPGISSVVLGIETPHQVEANVSVASLPPLANKLRERLIDTFSERGDEFNTGT